MARVPDSDASASLRAAADENLHLHMRWVQERTPGMHVSDRDDLLVVDSGLSCDTFNFVSRARLDRERAAGRVSETIEYFDRLERPFSWWVGLTDEPADLGQILEDAGLRPFESEVAMSVSLPHLRLAPAAPDGLVIYRVGTADQLEEYAGLLSSLWSPPDRNVIEFYRLAAPLLVAEECPIRLYLGSLDSVPVATAETTLSASAAGLYNISTSAAARGRGIGGAMTSVPLLEARRIGYELGVLQAAEAAVDLYRRVGFQAIGQYTEYRR